MKKLIFTAAIATMLSVTAFADGGKKATTETGEQNVSYAVLTQFKSDFENVSNVIWTVTTGSQKVSFTKNNVNYTAYYDSFNEYFGLAQEVSFATVTNAIKTTIAKDYSSYAIKSVTRFEAQDGEEPVVYFINVKNTANNVILTISPNDGEVKNIEKIK
ncbi:hypothetical protein [Mucilaginibacter sp. UR6-11]|uniref:hypothetical protein n=1 Tax=Mucilaginibacter sp. UR6-11 TaxID=1435644 RepID=UPI001E436716|nr:hypothetical protein [Mucilaginibacter sp. UR6-11]MCC8426035.1 hypothetical protein [Mucilaginibacter sp. UR6-11]